MMLSSLIQHRTEARHTPRFGALALFGRRLSEPGDGLGMPASENLHKSGSTPLE